MDTRDDGVLAAKALWLQRFVPVTMVRCGIYREIGYEVVFRLLIVAVLLVGVDKLVAFIELEKQAVEQVCASVLRDPSADVPQAQRIQDSACQATFFTNLAGVISSTGSFTEIAPSSIYHALSNVMGNRSVLESTLRRFARNHRFREFAGFFVGVKAWLSMINAGHEDDGNEDTTDFGALETVHRRKTLEPSAVSTTSTSTTTSRKPFDLDQDSVFQQVRSFRPATAADPSKPRKLKKLDPMKYVTMLCECVMACSVN